MNAYREVSAEELGRWRAQGVAHTLLDVREDDELKSAAVEGALHIPMAKVPERAAEIPTDRPIVVMCHLGARSARVAGYLAARGGYDAIYNLEGGIDAYARAVDPSIGSRE